MTADDDGVQELIVAEKRRIAEDVVAVTFVDGDGGALPRWQPGAHIDLELAPGLCRQFSLCSDPMDSREWTVAVLREPAGRGGSIYVHDRLAAGDRTRARGPRNRFPLAPRQRYLFVAGGIGITPILPMLTEVGSAGRLVYGGRSRTSMAFLDEVARLDPQAVIHPQDEAGLLPFEAILAETPTDTAVYACGPPAMLAALERVCSTSRHVLHLERFTPGPATAPQAADQAFEIELQISGMTLQVPPEQSILDVLERAGLRILSSCRAGTCGTCEIGVLAGVPDHRDAVLTDEEKAAGELIIACSSRAISSRLVLDL